MYDESQESLCCQALQCGGGLKVQILRLRVLRRRRSPQPPSQTTKQSILPKRRHKNPEPGNPGTGARAQIGLPAPRHKTTEHPVQQRENLKCNCSNLCRFLR